LPDRSDLKDTAQDVEREGAAFRGTHNTLNDDSRTVIRVETPMSFDDVETIRAIFDEAASAHQRFAARGVDAIARAAAAIRTATASGRKVLVFGNGGSAADAQHLAAELVGRFEIERRPLAAVALTPDSSIVTAIANDYGYEQVFTRQIEALGQSGDVAVGISTSGRSRNVEAALAAAKARGLVTVALTGRDGGKMGTDADIHLNVAESTTARVQEVHRTILHAMCVLIERIPVIT
jgi:D-sedoheptulose 7-phosphate isomerase